MCFTSCLTHGYIPPAMIETTIVPNVKNKSGNLLHSSNIGPWRMAQFYILHFAFAFYILLESVLLLKYVEYLSTFDNQCGFKSSHSRPLHLHIERIY